MQAASTFAEGGRDFEADKRGRGAASSLAALEGRVRRSSADLARGTYRRLVRGNTRSADAGLA